MRTAARAARAWAAASVLLAPAAHAVIAGSCSVSASGVAFGNYNPASSSPLSSTGSVTVTCTLVTLTNSVTIDLSTGSSNSFVTRTMSSGSDTLNYNLYLNASDTTIWGDGTGGSQANSLAINSGAVQLTVTNSATVYGLMPALQNPLPGTYSDTITVTVNY